MRSFGHSSPVFCHDGIDETARRVKAAGFDVWEVVSEGGHNLATHRAEFRSALKAHDLTLQVHAPLSDCNLGSLVGPAWELAVKSTEATLAAAADLGAAIVTIHPGNHTPLSRGHYDALHEATRRALHRLDRYSRGLGVKLALENVPNNWAFETDSAEKLLDLVDDTEAGLCFDLGHAHCAKRLDEFAPIARRILNVHVHDNKGDHDAHLTLDEGNLPWRATLDALTKGGYRGAFIVESNSHASGEASLKKLRAWAKEGEKAPARARGPKRATPRPA